MPSRSTEKRAGGKVVDMEVKSSYHDEILNWLISNIDEVVRTLFSWDVDQCMNAWGNSNLDRALDEVEQSVEELERRLSSADKESAEVGALRIKEGKAVLREKRSPPTGVTATLKAYEVMTPVKRIERKRDGLGRAVYGKETAAGFVDLTAVFHRPVGFVHSAVTPYGFHWGRDTEEEFANSLSNSNYGIESGPNLEETSLWVSVRSGAHTLGEILQELKTLQSLEYGSHEVALAVDGIEDMMRSRIEAEGFYVISMDDYR